MTVELAASIDPYRRAQTSDRARAPQEFEFEDLLDAINPLQHLPLIGWLYREISGDTMKTPAAIAGGALYGGPIGFASAVLSAAFESVTGESPEEFLVGSDRADASKRAETAYARSAGLAGG